MGSEVTEIVEMQGVTGLFLRTGVGGQNFGKQWKWRRQNRIAVGEEDSADGEGEKSGEAFSKKGGIVAVLVGERHESMGREVDEGIADDQGAGGSVKVRRLALARAG